MAESKISTAIEQIPNGSVDYTKYKMIFLLVRDNAINSRNYLVPYVFGGQGSYIATNDYGNSYCITFNIDTTNRTIGFVNCVRYDLNASSSKTAATAPTVQAVYGIR